jgi:hypothetical protein
MAPCLSAGFSHSSVAFCLRPTRSQPALHGQPCGKKRISGGRSFSSDIKAHSFTGLQPLRSCLCPPFRKLFTQIKQRAQRPTLRSLPAVSSLTRSNFVPNMHFYSTQLSSRIRRNSLKTQDRRHFYSTHFHGVLS